MCLDPTFQLVTLEEIDRDPVQRAEEQTRVGRSYTSSQ